MLLNGTVEPQAVPLRRRNRMSSGPVELLRSEDLTELVAVIGGNAEAVRDDQMIAGACERLLLGNRSHSLEALTGDWSWQP